MPKNLLILLFLFAFNFVRGAEDPGRPNIIFLLADDMGYGDLGCFGSAVIKSPNLDQLAAEGIKLTNCYAASPF
ncbi:MAG: sulfatase-like hydrolase/transferase [Verrucomicrobiales bacterium]|nr:sulfatase-like hydrolase/transferase [Verrucomicrobiales bacterium]